MTDRRRRVLLKLSGEAFGGGQLGVNPDIVSGIAKEIAEAAPKTPRSGPDTCPWHGPIPLFRFAGPLHRVGTHSGINK